MKQFILTSIMLIGSIAWAQFPNSRNYIYVQGDVKEGSVNFVRTSTELTIKVASDRALIDFVKFALFYQESVNIVQPAPSSVTIIRLPVDPVYTNQANPNTFNLKGGKIRSNGRLVIIAPQGIYINEHSRIDAKSLILTTADMKESDWQSNEFRFEDVLNYWGKIENEGTISTSGSGPITLAGDRISNEGTISAENNTVALVTAAAFTYSFDHHAILPESIRTVSKKQNLLNGLTKATVIYNDDEAKIIARRVNVDVNIDNNDGQTPVLLGGTIQGDLTVNSKARGWLWIAGTVQSDSVNILSTDDIWFADKAKVDAKSILVKATDEIRCKDTDGSGKFVSLDVSSKRGDAGNISMDARRMTLAGKMLAVGQNNGGNISVVSDTDAIKTNLKNRRLW